MAVTTTRSGWTGVMYRDPVNTNLTLTNVLGSKTSAEVTRVLRRLDALDSMKRSDVPALVDYALDFVAALEAVKLSPREADVYHARYVRQLSVGETALLLSMTSGTVNTYCKRIIAKVVSQLGGETT